jgi:hypothetical protein
MQEQFQEKLVTSTSSTKRTLSTFTPQKMGGLMVDLLSDLKDQQDLKELLDQPGLKEKLVLLALKGAQGQLDRTQQSPDLPDPKVLLVLLGPQAQLEPTRQLLVQLVQLELPDPEVESLTRSHRQVRAEHIE